MALNFPSQEQLADATKKAFSDVILRFKRYLDGSGSLPGGITFSQIRRTLKEIAEPARHAEDYTVLDHLDLPLREYLTDLVIRKRLLWYPGGHSAGGLGFNDIYQITRYGMNCWESGIDSLPIDRDLIIAEAKKRLPAMDEISEKYLAEGCTALSFGLLLSSSVCLGAASENEILNVIDLYSATDKPLKEMFQKKRHLSEKVEILVKSLKNNQAPKDDLEYLERMEALTRETRNAAGHPKIPKEREAQVKLLYEEFLQYLDALQRLRDWICKRGT